MAEPKLLPVGWLSISVRKSSPTLKLGNTVALRLVHPLYTEVLDTAATTTSTTFFRSGLVVLRTVSARKRQSEDYSVSEKPPLSGKRLHAPRAYLSDLEVITHSQHDAATTTATALTTATATTTTTTATRSMNININITQQ